MSDLLSVDNLVAWLVQIAVIALVGAALPTLLRVRHPKSQLFYYHAVLAFCFALPLLEPLRHPLLLVSGVVDAPAPPAAANPSVSWTSILLGILAAGVVVKLCWLAAGLWQLRRYRRSAIPLYPVPVAIHEARKLTGADAIFCVSKDVSGPATMGFADPVVLLPPSFLSLDEDAQRSVACHELLHVQRNDWLVTLLEEFAGALLWFQPAISWLLGKARLSREQLVDAEVVRLNAPAPYIEALLSMAVVSKGRFALPAAPFFTEGHLVHRMRSLLASPKRSLVRLCVSYLSAASLLGFAVWSVIVVFPLDGEAMVVLPTPRFGPVVVHVLASEPLAPKPAAPRAQQFDVRVPAPVDPKRNEHDVVYFVNAEGAAGIAIAPFANGFVPPPPPPPLMQTFTVRALRPGAIATPEEVQKFIDSFPQSHVQVTQTPEGLIQRVEVTRRISDEATTSPARRGFILGVVGANTATGAAISTEPGDSVH
jgi:hypothetical protein